MAAHLLSLSWPTSDFELVPVTQSKNKGGKETARAVIAQVLRVIVVVAS